VYEPPVFVAADGGVFGTMPSTITWLFGQQFAGGIHGALHHAAAFGSDDGHHVHV